MTSTQRTMEEDRRTRRDTSHRGHERAVNRNSDSSRNRSSSGSGNIDISTSVDRQAGRVQPSTAIPEPHVSGFRSRIQRSAIILEDRFARVRRKIRSAMGANPPRYIQPYIGYGSDDHGWIRGRVLANKPPRGPRDNDDWWDNLRNMYRRWESDEVAGAEVRATYQGRTYETVTDDEGYFTFEIDFANPHPERGRDTGSDAGTAQHDEVREHTGRNGMPRTVDRDEVTAGGSEDTRAKAAADPDHETGLTEEPAVNEGGSRFWRQVHLDLVDPEPDPAAERKAQEDRDQPDSDPTDAIDTKFDARTAEAAAAHAIGHIMVLPDTAQYGVISDIDDTVIESSITSLVSAAKVTFLNNARTRVPLAGVSALYRAFRRGTGHDDRDGGCGNPIFYISSSAWNLYDLICDFLDLNDIPLGPVILRALGAKGASLKKGHSHKLEKAERVMQTYPNLPFILLGDSGQHDAQLYLEAVRRYPNRILAIYIRDIDPLNASARDEQVQACAAEASEYGVPMLLVPDSHAIADHASGLGLIEPEALAAICQQVECDQRIAEGENAVGTKDAEDVTSRPMVGTLPGGRDEMASHNPRNPSQRRSDIAATDPTATRDLPTGLAGRSADPRGARGPERISRDSPDADVDGATGNDGE